MARTVRVDSSDDERLADYRRLNDQRERRRLEGDEFFIAEGYVAIDRLIESGHGIRSVLLGTSRVDRFERHLDELERRDVPVYVAERDVITEVVGFDLHRGVVAAGVRRAAKTIDELAGEATRLAVLEGLNDAENLGAISRAARALGIEGIVIDATCTDPYSRRTVRVSMGEVLFLPIARASEAQWPDVLDRLHRHGFETWALTPADDADDLWDVEIPKRLAVVLGAEGPGLDHRTSATATRRVRIPIDPAVDSLNVGHAAAITFAAIGR